MNLNKLARKIGVYALLCAFGATGVAWAQKKTEAEISAEFAKFRKQMEQDNPAELFELQGEEIWKTKRGPKNVSLQESCDLGKGVGNIEGAYVEMPRYFADAKAVMDTERRIVWCMVEKQGFDYKSISKKPFASKNSDKTPDITNLVMYVAGGSRDMKFNVNLEDEHVKEIYEVGKEIIKFRAGPYDFACTTCHGADNLRIRMQSLPNITKSAGAIRSRMGWPAYRMSGGIPLTLQWRLRSCFRQQRFPFPTYASDLLTSVLTYMTANANGAIYSGPGIKR